MKLLAVDPGPSSCGWAHVRMVDGRAHYIDGGKFDSTRTYFVNVLEGWATDVVAIEMPEGFIHEPFRGPPLLQTARVAGGIEWECDRRGLRTITLSATSWRKTLCGGARPGDGVIADVVRANVAGLPALTNVHVRDALGLAIVAGWIAIGSAGTRAPSSTTRARAPRRRRPAA